MSKEIKSQDLAFPVYMTACATIAALSGLNVGWHISVPNMPEKIMKGIIEPDGSYHCLPGTDESGPLAGCLPMDSYTWGYTIGAYAIGGFFGSLASKYSNVWFGRKDNIMISCLWMIVGGILSACAINLGMYAVGRAFVGIASGMCGSSVAIYVSEISTNKSRGALGSLFELFLNTGILLTQVTGRYLTQWRYLWAIPTILAAIQLILLYFFTVESPRRLCANKEFEKARSALLKLRAGADIEQELNALMLARQQEAASAQQEMSIWDIVSGKDRQVTWNTVIVMVTQAYNQIGGIGPISVYSVGFFTTIFHDATLAINITLATSTINIVATLVAVVYMHKVGRKGFMMISTGGTCIASVMLVLGASLRDSQGSKGIGGLAIAAAILFAATYSMGCGVIPWLLAPELLPMHALAAGSAMGNSSNWLFNFIINTIWPQMDQHLGTYSFVVFAVINLVGFLFLTMFMPETTNRDLDHQPNGTSDIESSDTSKHSIPEKEIQHHIETD